MEGLEWQSVETHIVDVCDGEGGERLGIFVGHCC